MRLPIPSLDGVKTARLLFRKPVIDDTSWWMEYISDAKTLRFMPLHLGGDESCRAIVQHSLE